MKRCILFGFLLLFAACTPVEDTPAEPLQIVRIESSDQPIEPGKPLPEFKMHFGTGVTAIYSYVWLQNTQTMTGSYPVRMRWFSPNDFRPPIAQRVVDMEPEQEIAQFSVHSESGLQRGPYMLLVRAGKSMTDLTASGSSRFYIGMTDEEVTSFLQQEAEYKKKQEEEREKRRVEEEAKILEEDEEDAEDSPPSPFGLRPAGEESEDDPEDFEAIELPPSLTSGEPE